MHPDIVILGAGVIGSSVAWHLAQRGCRNIVVLDRANDFGGGSTAKATGGFRAQFETETEVRLSLRSREKLIAFPDEVGCDSGYRPVGYLFVACKEDELALMRKAQKVQHACGVSSRMVSADEARAINPAIGDATVIGGSFCPTDGFIRPMNILRGYADAAKRLGVRFEFGVEHRGWRVEGDRVVAASTSRGDVHGSVFVNAMGAFSGAPVVPVRRNIAATVPTSVLGESMPMTIWAGDWYHVRVRDGRVLLVWPDDPPYEHWLAWVQRLTRERMPCLNDIPIDECWSGFYEMTPDGRALLGRSLSHDNVYLATGCSGHGVMHAPAIGEVMAELVMGATPAIDVSELRPDRFGAPAARAG